MTLIIIISISFVVVLGIVLGVYLLIAKKKEHEIEGGSKMDALAQNQPVGQDMFSQPLPQGGSNPLMEDSMAQNMSSMPPAANSSPAPAMNDITSFSSEANQINTSAPQPIEPSQMTAEQPAEETPQIAMDQNIPSPEETASSETLSSDFEQSPQSTPDFPNFSATNDTSAPVVEPVAINLENNAQPEVPAPVEPTVVVPENSVQPEVPAPEQGTVQPSVSDFGTSSQESSEEPAVPEAVTVPEAPLTVETPVLDAVPQISVEQPSQFEQQASVVPSQPQESSAPVESPQISTMHELSRGLNDQSQQASDENTEPPVQNI